MKVVILILSLFIISNSDAVKYRFNIDAQFESQDINTSIEISDSIKIIINGDCIMGKPVIVNYDEFSSYVSNINQSFNSNSSINNGELDKNSKGIIELEFNRKGNYYIKVKIPFGITSVSSNELSTIVSNETEKYLRINLNVK